jgi:uncharacterized protein YheU (UPF0270 family)
VEAQQQEKEGGRTMSNEATLQQMQHDIARGNETAEKVMTWDPATKRLVIKPAKEVQPDSLNVGVPEVTVGG